MKSKSIAALVAAAGLAWGTAHAAPDVAESLPQESGVIVLEMQPIPGVEPGSAQEQAIFGMLLQQLLEAIQGQGQEDNVEVQFVPPPQAQRI